MNEINILDGYPEPKKPRYVSSNLRTINHRLIALNRDRRFFDGKREFGYGGFKYDGRWQGVAENIISRYFLNSNQKVLQINSEKGFLLSDLKRKNNKLEVFGTETSDYAIKNTDKETKKNIVFTNPTNLPFSDNFFDLVIGLGVVYTQNLENAVKILKEIKRVSKKNSFVTLASYNNPKDYFLFKDWTLLGATILKKIEWIEVLKSISYEGDYSFTNASTLKLIRK